MKLADFYINDKHLIYKLFHVIVPRFESATFGQYTRMYRLQPTGDGVNPGHANERLEDHTESFITLFCCYQHFYPPSNPYAIIYRLIRLIFRYLMAN